MIGLYDTGLRFEYDGYDYMIRLDHLCHVGNKEIDKFLESLGIEKRVVWLGCEYYEIDGTYFLDADGNPIDTIWWQDCYGYVLTEVEYRLIQLSANENGDTVDVYHAKKSF